jgi:CheY-like chemotaxis protein
LSSPLRVLLVEDSVADAVLVERMLHRVGRELVLRRVRDEWQMRTELADAEWDMVVADLVLPSFTGLEALGIVQEGDADVPCILLSGIVGEGAALAAMRAGARDFLSKSDLSRLPAIVERELREAAARGAARAGAAELAALREQVARDTERHAERLGALHELAVACREGADEESLAAAAAEQAGRLLQADAGLAVADPATGRWLFATSGGARWRAEPGPEEVLVTAAAGGARVLACPCQVLRLPSGHAVTAAFACAVPLTGVGGPIGGLAAWTSGPREFGPDDVAQLELVAALAAPTLESIRLVRDAGEPVTEAAGQRTGRRRGT